MVEFKIKLLVSMCVGFFPLCVGSIVRREQQHVYCRVIREHPARLLQLGLKILSTTLV
jgi:hypothetical protein